MTDTFDLLTDVSGSGSYQGQLASSYTTWVAGQVTGAAEWIAYQWYIGGEASEERLEIAKQIADDLAAGEFSLQDLFLAAQTKGSATLTDIAGTPKPVLLVSGESIDLTDFFGEATALAEWSSGPKKLTEHHYRELLTDFESGTPPDGWDDPAPTNHAPTLIASDPNHALVEAGESLLHVIEPGVSTATVQLTAADADSDPTSFNTSGWADAGGGVFTKAGTYGTASLNTATGLVTYTLDPNVDLNHDVVKHDSFTMSVSDGSLDSNTATFTFDIQGTGDWYHVDATPIVVTKGDAVPDSGSLQFITNNVEDIVVTITGKGDYDWDKEGFQVGGDVALNFDGANGSNATGNFSPETLLNVSMGPAAAVVSVSGSSDGDLDYTVTFDAPTQNDSTVTITVGYDYWI
jgi:VCBS repeat-containing protein